MITTINEFKKILIKENFNTSIIDDNYINSQLDNDMYKNMYSCYAYSCEELEDEIYDSDEYKEYVETQINNRLDEITEEFYFFNWPLIIYRAITVDENWNIENQPLGIYWTYDINSADTYWGYDNKKQTIIIEAQVTKNDINWDKTLLANLDICCGDDEKEVTLNEGSLINVLKYTNSNNEIVEVNKQLKV